MGWNLIGWFLAIGIGTAGTAVTYLYPDHRDFGYVLLLVAAVAAVLALLGLFQKLAVHIRALHARIGIAKVMLLFGIVGTWAFVTLTLAVLAWSLIYPPPTLANTTPVDEGPISWFQGFTSMDGGMNGFNVFALTFQGANVSKDAIELKSAHITSLIDGTRLDLEIIGTDASGDSKLVPINSVQLITPGAPIELKAKFGPPAPNEPGKVMGLDPTKFLEKWRQFAFDAVDDKRSYHFEINERSFMGFFRGKVGPRVTIKPDATK